MKNYLHLEFKNSPETLNNEIIYYLIFDLFCRLPTPKHIEHFQRLEKEKYEYYKKKCSRTIINSTVDHYCISDEGILEVYYSGMIFIPCTKSEFKEIVECTSGIACISEDSYAKVIGLV